MIRTISKTSKVLAGFFSEKSGSREDVAFKWYLSQDANPNAKPSVCLTPLTSSLLFTLGGFYAPH